MRIVGASLGLAGMPRRIPGNGRDAPSLYTIFISNPSIYFTVQYLMLVFFF